MPDPFRHVRKGEPIDFNAQAWNAIVDAARAEQKRRHDLGSVAADLFRQGSIIKIKNQSGVDLDQFDVLGLDQPMFLPMVVDPNPDVFMRPLAFRGTLPHKPTHLGKFAIVLDPLRIGGIGRAYVDGVVQVKINVLDPGHTCADIQDGNTEYLVSYAEGGSAQILWKQFQETGKKGLQWAVVRMGTNCKICCRSSSSSSSSSSQSECQMCANADVIAGLPSCSDCHCETPNAYDVTLIGGCDVPECITADGAMGIALYQSSVCTWVGTIGPLNVTIEVAGGVMTITIGCTRSIPPVSFGYEATMPHHDCMCPNTLGFSGGDAGGPTGVFVTPHKGLTP